MKNGSDITTLFFVLSSAFFGNILALFGDMHLFIASWIQGLAPFHFPGPCNLYWAGKHGPNMHLKANHGSSINSFLKSGFTPILLAISSMYSIQNVCKKINVLFSTRIKLLFQRDKSTFKLNTSVRQGCHTSTCSRIGF